MKWHRRRVDALNETIRTERFDLVPVGKPRALQLFRRLTEDAELLLQLSHSDKKPSLWRMIRKYPLPNRRSRHMHEIVVRETGASIGYHEIKLMHYHSAMLGVVILDRGWWGKSVPIEVRQAILAHFAKHAGVERFCGAVESRNFASVLNYKKLGFRHNGTMHRCEFDSKNQVPLDYLQFELLKEDFPAYIHGGIGMNMMDAARHIVAQATRMPLEEIKEDSAIESLAAWDSIAHIAIILAVEEKLARPLTAEAIVSVSSVRTIADLLDTANGGS